MWVLGPVEKQLLLPECLGWQVHVLVPVPGCTLQRDFVLSRLCLVHLGFVVVVVVGESRPEVSVLVPELFLGL